MDELEHLHVESADFVSRCDELVTILDSGEPVIREVKNLSAVTSKVADKISKTEIAITSTTQSENVYVVRLYFGIYLY